MSIFAVNQKQSIQSGLGFRKNIACDNETCGCRVSNFLWISHKHKLIYIEVPKNGCSTVKASLEMKITDAHVVEAYLRKKIFQKNVSTMLTPIGFGNEINLEFMRKSLNVVMKKIDQGDLETTPTGQFEFQHSFDEPYKLANRYSDYQIFTVIRDPLSRFMSGLNMFYGGDNEGRRYQRLSHSILTSSDGIDVNLAVEDIFRFSNHHFETVHNFCGGVPVSRMTLVPIESLTKFLEAKSVKVNMQNVSKAKLYAAKDLTDDNLSMIEKKYEIDKKLFSDARNY